MGYAGVFYILAEWPGKLSDWAIEQLSNSWEEEERRDAAGTRRPGRLRYDGGWLKLAIARGYAGVFYILAGKRENDPFHE
jgi:hypothetical protein